MRQSKYRYVIPNGVTFLSLACGVLSILASSNDSLKLAGFLILASYVLDLFDGELARRLHATSDFGLQLDSLTDVISLGTAPAVLAFSHLQASNVAPLLLWPVIVLFVLAGAFRLARFNLLPMKEGQVDSVGLTISTAGATLTLAILSDLANEAEFIPDTAYLPLMLVLSLLMVSRIAHPSITSVFSRRWANLVYAAYIATCIFLLGLSFFNIWFIFNGGYLGAALLRAGYRQWGQ
jgi:CDP-diacylglycerol--serine O-phosphatidyltransferase